MTTHVDLFEGFRAGGAQVLTHLNCHVLGQHGEQQSFLMVMDGNVSHYSITSIHFAFNCLAHLLCRLLLDDHLDFQTLLGLQKGTLLLCLAHEVVEKAN